ncbi:MAG: helix-turn-helix domain-containing protein [Chloroflexi bacterium]|nr:helix-turn-helix domain-containing protein [Chloroflexota bacterium]
MVIEQTRPEPADEPRWVSLSRAGALLGVSQATLRQWADRGQIRSFRTPGGHRRFAESDLQALRVASPSKEPGGAFDAFGDRAAGRIRRRFLQQPNLPQAAWRLTLDDDGRERLRLFGRQLLTLVMSSAGRRRSRVAAEARALGDAYAHEGQRRGLRLAELLEAFVFFREALDGAVQAQVRHEGSTTDQVIELWRRVNSTLDEVLLAAALAYEQSDAPAPASPESHPLSDTLE